MPENGVFQCRVDESLAPRPGERCLAELDYGIDAGLVLELFSLDERADGGGRAPAFRVVRKVTPEDECRMGENAAAAEKAKHAFALSTAREKGHVRILHARFSYGGERLFIRYSALVPVDLRRFIKQLQRDFKTQVDLWQVNVRDAAALTGCVGSCGRAACCCSWLRQFQTTHVRMAKAQELSLNPAAINGTCGRLKCCLRFEYDQYLAAGERLPEHGSLVVCRDDPDRAEGWVTGRDILRGRLTVRTEDGRFLTVDAASVTVTKPAVKRDNEKDDAHEDSSGEWA
jgi:cell fate regulator YaaT (PSP1 superfamily)